MRLLINDRLREITLARCAKILRHLGYAHVYETFGLGDRVVGIFHCGAFVPTDSAN